MDCGSIKRSGRLRAQVSCIGLIAVTLSLLLGCTEKVGEEECDQAFDHLVNVRSSGEPELVQAVKKEGFEEERPAFIEACISSATADQIKCWMEAKTTAEMRSCEKLSR